MSALIALKRKLPAINSTPRYISLLLEFESSQQAIFEAKFRSTSIDLWPYLRTQLWVEMSHFEFPSEVNHYALSSVEKCFEMFKNLFSYRIYGRGSCSKSKVLFVASGRTLIKQGEEYSNWLIDHISKECGSKSIIYLHRPFKNKFKNSSKPDACIYGVMYLKSILASVMGRVYPNRYFKEVDSCIDEVFEYFNTFLPEDSKSRIKRNIRTLNFKSRFEKRLWTSILTRVDPSMIVIEDASYGAMSVLVKLSKAKKIQVIEPQHGWIGPAHASYNYGSFLTKEHGSFLPDQLLTFGNYWTSQIHHPATFTAIGKPILNKVAEARDLSGHENVALFVSSGNDLVGLVNLVIDTAKDAQDLGIKVLLRLHPSEISKFHDSIKFSLRDSAAMLDENYDIYETLRSVKWVVGYSSTVLFEAIAIGVKPIAIESSLSKFYCDPSLMAIAGSAPMIIEAFKSPWINFPLDFKIHEVWASDSPARVKKFLEDKL